MDAIQQLLMDIGWVFHTQSGDEFRVDCLHCGGTYCGSVNIKTGKIVCFKCDLKSHWTRELREFKRFSFAETEKYAKEHYSLTVEKDYVGQDEGLKPVNYTFCQPQREATEKEIADMCAVKGLPVGAFQKFAGVVYYYEHPVKSSKTDGEPRLMIPAYMMRSIDRPVTHLEVKIDGKPFNFSMTGDHKPVKYKIAKGSTHGIIGLHYMMKTDPQEVIITEGWRDAVAAVSYGYCALASSGGCSTFDTEILPLLRGKTVYLIFDADVAGQRQKNKLIPEVFKAAKATYDCTLPYGVQKSNGQDLYDYYNTPGNTAAKFRDEILDKGALVVDGTRAVLPYDNNSLIAEEFYSRCLRYKHVHFNETWYEYNIACQKYRELKETAIRKKIGDFMANLKIEKKIPGPAGEKIVIELPLSVTTHKCNDVMFCYSFMNGVNADIMDRTHDTRLPLWIKPMDNTPSPDHVIAMGNCLLDITQSPPRKLSLTPNYLTTAYRDYDYNDSATCPLWESFITQLFKYRDEESPSGYKRDTESERLVQEYVGLLLTPITKYQKLLTIIGSPGSGKGVFMRIVAALAGDGSVVETNLSQLSKSNEFGLQPMIGKTVAMIRDARQGGNSLFGSEEAIEIIKNITGEDNVTINKKHKTQVASIKLPVRFLIACNALQRFRDPSGSLFRRWMFVETTSVVATPDIGLTEKLLAELPGIFNWALAGFRRLEQRGNFIEPGRSEAVKEEFFVETTPLRAFLQEYCQLGNDYRVAQKDLYEAYKTWAAEEGMTGLKTRRHFFDELHALEPSIRDNGSGERYKARNYYVKMYYGVDLLPRFVPFP